jgi:hypothetical protein
LPHTVKKKAECERVLLDNSWLDVIIFRPGLFTAGMTLLTVSILAVPEKMKKSFNYG